MSQDDMWAPSGTHPLIGDDEGGSDTDMDRRRGSLPYTGADGRSTNASVYGGGDDERGSDTDVVPPPSQPTSYIDPLEALLASPMPPPPPPFPKRQTHFNPPSTTNNTVKANPTLSSQANTNVAPQVPPPTVLTTVDLTGRGSAAQDPTTIIRRLRSTIVGKEKEIVALTDQLSEMEGRLHEREMDHIKKDATIKRLEALREGSEGREAALNERANTQEARIVELEAQLEESKVKTDQVEAAARVLMGEVEQARTTAHFRIPPTTTTPQVIPTTPHRSNTPPPVPKVRTPRAASKEVGTSTPPFKKPKTHSSPTQTKAPSTTKDASTVTEARKQQRPSSGGNGGGGGTLDDPSPEYLWATSAAVVLRYYEGVIATQLDEGYEWASLLDTYLGIKEQYHINMLQQVSTEERSRYDRRVAALHTSPQHTLPNNTPSTIITTTGSPTPPSNIRAELDALRMQLVDSEEEHSALTNQILLADETIHSMKAALQETAQARDNARVSAADYRHEVQRLSMIIANTCTDGVHAQHSRDSVMEIVKERDAYLTALKSLRKEVQSWKGHPITNNNTSSTIITRSTDVNKSMSSAMRESAVVMRALIDEQRAKQGKPTTSATSAPSSRSASHHVAEKTSSSTSLPPTRQFPTVSTAPVTPRHVNTGVTNAGGEDPEVGERMRVALLQRIDDLCSPDRDRRARVVREYKGWMESTDTLVMDASAEASATTPRSQRPGWR